MRANKSKRRIGLLADACAKEEKTCLNEPASYMVTPLEGLKSNS